MTIRHAIITSSRIIVLGARLLDDNAILCVDVAAWQQLTKARFPLSVPELTARVDG